MGIRDNMYKDEINCKDFIFRPSSPLFHGIAQHVLPKFSKITVTCPKSVKTRVNFDLLKVRKMNINFELFKVSKMTHSKIYISIHREPRNIKLGQQVKIKRATLGTQPQVVVMSLAHNYVTNLFILSYRGATLIKSCAEECTCDRMPHMSKPVKVTSPNKIKTVFTNFFLKSY